MNLIIKSLNFSYQSEDVFKDLNLNFNSGILNLVSGPSGSGKTTLGMEFLVRGANAGEACAHFTATEPSVKLLENILAHCQYN